MSELVKDLEHIIWSYLAIPILLFVSLIFTFYFQGVQFRFKKMIQCLTKKSSNSSVSSFQSFTMALAARVGVGSLAGVALGIYIGGPGSVFWMWISALITAAASFVESTLAQLYKKRDGDIYIGGPAYYIEYGMHQKGFAVIYAFIIVLTYTFGFSAIQANTIATSFRDVLSIPPLLTGVGLALITSMIIFGGASTIAKMTSKIVPIMALFYIGIGLFVMITHFDYIPTFFMTIFQDAFQPSPLIGGTVMYTIIIGIKRGVFSNEAGMGSGAHAAAVTNSDNATDQGYIQSFGVYVTTLFICTITAFLIMVTNAVEVGTTHSNGIELTQYALTELFGPIGGVILAISIFFFAFSTILTGYFYGECNVKYLCKNEKILYPVRVIVLIVILISSIGSASLIWSLVDLGVALTATINVMALCYLAKEVKVIMNKKRS
ncbi:alanine:cation symporter family protein [Turicibacter bilis]|uniref:alanine/glycine:cation symporter family protein n=1 Tax=Turicibacter bilis TaxID=2735723 RepID=UPI001BB07272|nr:alanine/glycine:cation symporter family protein [Turicibacter bilis]MBS3203130.1 alanine:cation symporter family protein [Turicibacter bilis]UUF11496.1 alanine:cation symporter family protein [Turicibacter bilis]